MRRAGTLATVATAALLLAACGEATVDSSDVTGTSPTSSATSSPTSSAEPSTSTATTTATSTATSAAETTASSGEASTSTSASPVSSAARPPAGEQPAREVSSAPSASANYSPGEQRFLEELSNKGVNVNGVEDQLTATGLSLCDGTTFTRDAVAGQLVEQRRTNLDPAAAAKLIDETAHANLC